MALPRIDINSADFNEQAFAALEKKRGFILTNLDPDFTTATEALFRAYNDFLLSGETKNKQFKGSADNLQGFFAFDEFTLGGKYTDRWFMRTNAENKPTHPLPSPNNVSVSMEEATTKLMSFAEIISGKVIGAIEKGLQLPDGTLRAMVAKDKLTVLNHYYPTTQEKLDIALKNNKLTLSPRGKLLSFEKHQDLDDFTFLIFGEDDPNGFIVKTKNNAGQTEFQEIGLEQKSDTKENGLSVVVILGKIMSVLTNNFLKGLTHAVETQPLAVGETFKRVSISIFNFPRADAVLKPLRKDPSTTDAATRPFQTLPSFYAENSGKYSADLTHRSLTSRPETFKEFPTEDDIKKECTPDKIVYRRIR